jgi:branched-chain amino acid transport system permease protein
VGGGLYALTASGLNLVFGVMKILNIAHGEMLMLGAYTAFWAFTVWGINPLMSVLLTGPLLFIFGVLVYIVLLAPILRTKPTPDRLEKSTLIGFFGVLIVLQNTALLAWTADYRVLTVLQSPIRAVSMSVGRVAVFGISVGLVVLLYLLLAHTAFGRAVRAVSQDREMASLLAIDVRRIGLIAFALGAALAGVAGSLGAVIYVTTPTMGLMFTLKAFTVMVIGGLGNVLGTIVAGFALGVAEEFGAFWIGEPYKDVIDYVVLIVVILLISYGWLRRRDVA